jgi:hypothetical protein
MDKNITAEQLAELAHKARPTVHYRAAADGASVAAWSGGRWVPVAGNLIGGLGWCSMEHELFVHGKPAYDPGLYGPAPEAPL